MNVNTPPEDRQEDLASQRVFDWLSGDLVPPAADDVSGQLDTLTREHLEILGALPYSLDEVAPPPRVKESLMLAIAAGGSADDASAEVRDGAEIVPFRQGNRSRVARWALPLAASLALVVGVSAWQQGRVEERQATIEELASRLSDTNREAAQLAGMKVELEETRSKLAMITSTGAEVCNLQPVGEGATHENSHGALFVASDHQRWYLKIDGLEPCPMGRVYQLWFIGPDGGVSSAGTFEVESGVNVELTSETMPEGTRAVQVTLEPRGGSEQPTGPAVLSGNEVTRVL